MLKLRFLLSVIFLFLYLNLIYPSPFKIQQRYIAQPINEAEKEWVDSIMNKLTLREKIGQLFFVAAYSNQGQKHIDNTINLINKYKIGGLVFFQGSPTKQAQLSNLYQSKSKVPLIIGIDAEWGVAMRLDSVIAFPKQMTLGAITNNKLIYDFGAEMARQCKLLGVHINFTPSVDVNNNPNNSVINTRSFGENQYNVAEKGVYVMRGLQDNDILACAKHFPGHGDTNVDSHHDLPVIPYSKERLDTLELYPFKQMIDNGVASIMVGHLYISSIDTKDELPASLSEKIIRSILKNELNFEGLVITDALNMKAAKGSIDEHLAVSVLKAGNDILLMIDDVKGGIDAVEKAINNDILTIDQIEDKCRKILTAKYRVGLKNYKPIQVKGLINNLTTPYSKTLYKQLIESALTLVANKDSIIPIKNLDEKQIAYLEIGKNRGKYFEEQLSLYTEIKKISIDRGATNEQLKNIKKQLSKYNTIIVGYHRTDNRSSRGFGVDSTLINFLDDLAKEKKIIFAFFGSPYFLSEFKNTTPTYDAIIVAYENSEEAQNLTAQGIFGGIAFKGKLPVSSSEEFKAGFGIDTESPIRLKYISYDEIGISDYDIYKIDSLITNGIKQKAYPGCQVIAAYKGQVFYNKSFGNHTYDRNSTKVKISDLYDVASVTKVSATVPLIMKMVDNKQIYLNNKLKNYVKLHGDKGNLIIRDILIHQAGLRAFIPFYLSMLTVSEGEELFSQKSTDTFNIQIPGMKKYVNKNNILDPEYFSNKKSNTHNYPVANSLYSSTKTKEYIYSAIDTSKLLSKSYRYSDLGFIYLQRIIETSLKKQQNILASNYFYSPLGMNNTMYLPLTNVSKTRITPTEKDDVFRRQLIQGYVHDPAAAMLGGIAGHAGLFSNANDLAKLLQMYLNKGQYGGKRYIDSSTVITFTKYHNQNQSRRGLGFDKPETNPKKASPVCKEASTDSYGHSGFTGALVWVDPQRDLIYVFLSNRINPSTENMRITKLSTRSEVLAQFLKIIDRLKDDEKN